MIGIFDSGIGGLTVVKAIQDELPGVSLLYLGDTARVPYGNKSPETVERYAREEAQWLKERGVFLFVIACNTSSALAGEKLSAEFSETFFDVIGPAVEEALAVTRNGRIGVIGTRATIGSGVYERLLTVAAPEVKVFSIACPLFVSLVEEDWLERRETEMIAEKYLAPLREANIDTLILGCTHYPLLKTVIARVMGEGVRLVDSATSVAREVKDYVTRGDARGGTSKFFLTDLARQYDMIASRWLERPVRFEQARFGNQ